MRSRTRILDLPSSASLRCLLRSSLLPYPFELFDWQDQVILQPLGFDHHPVFAVLDRYSSSALVTTRLIEHQPRR